ncbi:Peptidyl-tRNA hydrolase [Chitinispirillum alkaliphilum]|nr:Peptidyl-tRNA hydrolase [Chitinispirillum alkaliphilum]
MGLFKLFGKILTSKKVPLKADKLIVGLGNPGKEYLNTRHNVGFKLVDALAEQMTYRSDSQMCSSSCVTGSLAGFDQVVLVKPLTYMNRSGEALSACMNLYNLPLSDCLVVVDDFNLPLGSFRFRKGGSHGGHNGLKSISAFVGSQFPRLRVGIGPLPQGTDIISFVLGEFSDPELLHLKRVIYTAKEAVIYSMENGLEKAMNKYNSVVVE